MKKKNTMLVSSCAIILVVISFVLVAVLTRYMHPDEKETTKQLSIGTCGGGSDIDGIKLDVTINEQHNWNMDSENPTLSFQWVNEKKEDFSYPLSFDILKQENDEWVSCATEEIDFPTAFGTVAANSSTVQKYSVSGFNLLQSGLYRFIVQISETENVWHDFQVEIASAG